MAETEGHAQPPKQSKDGLAIDIHPATHPHDKTPVQRMTFERFAWIQNPLNWGWRYNNQERTLLRLEENLRDLLDRLAPFRNGVYAQEIGQARNHFTNLSTGDYREDQYGDVWEELSLLTMTANTLLQSVSQADEEDNQMQQALTSKQGAFTKQIITSILKVYRNLPEPMRIPKNKELIKQALYPDLRMIGSFDEEDLAQSTANFAQARGNLLSANFKRMHERIASNWDQLSQMFNLGGQLATIELTGSDFHNEGQQVAFVTSTTGRKTVYKPRTLSPDTALVGHEGSAFSTLNELSGGKVKLPTMTFGETKDDKGSYGFAEFQEKLQEQSVEQVKSLYQRYGELAVASKLLGVNDLHNENILATAGTPVVIDAETSFLPYVMQVDQFSATALDMALGSVKKHLSTEAAENFFYTPEERLAYEGAEAGFVNYVTGLRQNDLNGAKTYLPEFKRGMTNMIGLVKDKKKEVIEMILGLMRKTRHVRLVPLKTQDFQNSIRAYRGLVAQGRPADADNVVGEFVEKVKSSIKAKGFSIISSDWEANVNSTVGRALKIDYEKEDTPILHFEPIENRLLYHGRDVGFSEDWEEPEDFVTKRVNRIANADINKIMADLEVGQ